MLLHVFARLHSSLSSVVVQLLNLIWLFATPWPATHQASLSFTVSCSWLKLMSIESVMPSILSSHPLSSPSPPALNLFQHQGLFEWTGTLHQGAKVGASASASVLPMTIEGWSLLGLTGLISLLSEGLSRVFSSTTIQKHHYLLAPINISLSWCTTIYLSI